MEKLRYYYRKVSPYLTRSNLELATVLVIVLSGLFVYVTGRPSQAVLRLQDGAITYDGQVVGQKMSGDGKMTFANGDSYQGEFSAGTFNGKGTFKSSTGWTYQGEFSNGLAHGKGKLTTETGAVYDGQFEEGVYQDEN